MKTALVVFAFVLVLTNSSIAQQKIEGKWDCDSEDVKHTKLHWLLEIRNVNERLSAHMSGGLDDADGFELENVSLDGDMFKGSITINPPDDITTLSLKLNGNRLVGGFEGKGSGSGTYLCQSQR